LSQLRWSLRLMMVGISNLAGHLLRGLALVLAKTPLVASHD